MPRIALRFSVLVLLAARCLAAPEARLERTPRGLAWTVTREPLPAPPVDAGLAKFIRATLAQQLTPEKIAVVGHNPRALAPGENLVAVASATIGDGRRSRFVTSDWVAKNARNYLGENPPALTERASARLKTAVLAVLRPSTWNTQFEPQMTPMNADDRE